MAASDIRKAYEKMVTLIKKVKISIVKGLSLKMHLVANNIPEFDWYKLVILSD